MRPRVWRGLDEIYAGVFDGMTYAEIEQRFPAEASTAAVLGPFSPPPILPQRAQTFFPESVSNFTQL